MSFQKTVTNKGITVVTEKMASVRSISLGIWFNVGSRDELPKEAGISHFLEHMMFKGTSTRSAKDLSEQFDTLGARQNAFTSKEVTCYYADFIDESLPQVFELLADMVSNATFEQSACELEREVVIEEIARSEDDPEDIAHDLFCKSAWYRHTLGRGIAGFRKTVATFGHDDACAYRAKHYLASNCIVSAAGNVNHSEIVEMVESYLSGLSSGSTSLTRVPAGSNNPETRFQYKDTEQAHIFYGTSCIDARSEKRYALSLLNSIFGGSMSSRLFQEVREKLGLVYAIYCFPQMFLDSGLFSVYAGTRPENAQLVLDTIKTEIDKIDKRSITPAELDRARSNLKGHLALSLESTSRRMIRIAEATLAGNDVLPFDDILTKYNNVTLADIHDLSSSIAGQDFTLAVVGPFTGQNFKEA